MNFRWKTSVKCEKAKKIDAFDYLLYFLFIKKKMTLSSKQAVM